MNAFERLIAGRSQGFLGQNVGLVVGKHLWVVKIIIQVWKNHLLEMLLEAFQPKKWLIVDLLSVQHQNDDDDQQVWYSVNIPAVAPPPFLREQNIYIYIYIRQVHKYLPWMGHSVRTFA